LQGLETGHATLGVVGTVSRLLVPMVVAEMRKSAPGLSLRLTEGASERLAGEVAERQLACAVVTEPASDPRLHVDHRRYEGRVALVKLGGVQLSLTDQAVHEAVRRILRDERRPDAERSA